MLYKGSPYPIVSAYKTFILHHLCSSGIVLTVGDHKVVSRETWNTCDSSFILLEKNVTSDLKRDLVVLVCVNSIVSCMQYW